MKALLILYLLLFSMPLLGQQPQQRLTLIPGMAITRLESGEQITASLGLRYQNHELNFCSHWSFFSIDHTGFGSQYRFHWYNGERFSANFNIMAGYYRYGFYIVLPDSSLDATFYYIQPGIGISYNVFNNVYLTGDLSLGRTKHVSDPFLGVKYSFYSTLMQAGIHYKIPLARRRNTAIETTLDTIKPQSLLSFNLRADYIFSGYGYFGRIFRRIIPDTEIRLNAWLRLCVGAQIKIKNKGVNVDASPVVYGGTRMFLLSHSRLKYYFEPTFGYGKADFTYGRLGYFQLKFGHYVRYQMHKNFHFDAGISHIKTLFYIDRWGVIDYVSWFGASVGAGVDFGKK